MSLLEYHKLTSRELLALTNKVRNLINHWGEDGRYKEAVLKNVIRRFIPEKFSIGTGFVVKESNKLGDHLSSRQIDLIIYDDESPILFKEGDFVILTPDAVRGIIEVKANLQNQDLKEVLTQANANGKFIVSGKEDKDRLFFNGIFSFDGYKNDFNLDVIIEKFNDVNMNFYEDDNYEQFKVNHVSLNENWFIKLLFDNPITPYGIYEIEELSFSVFISSLINTLSNKSVKENNTIWYANPLIKPIKRF